LWSFRSLKPLRTSGGVRVGAVLRPLRFRGLIATERMQMNNVFHISESFESLRPNCRGSNALNMINRRIIDCWRSRSDVAALRHISRRKAVVSSRFPGPRENRDRIGLMGKKTRPRHNFDTKIKQKYLANKVII
jgi:hypothetical protein